MMNIQKVVLDGCIAVIVFVLCLFTVRADAKDLIPRDDFIKYTEACMAVTDVMDVEFSKDEVSVIAITELKEQYDICKKKIDRYAYVKSKGTKQLDIRETLDSIGDNTALMIACINFIDAANKNYDILAAGDDKSDAMKKIMNDMGRTKSDLMGEITRSKIRLASALSNVQKAIKKLNSQYIIYKDKSAGRK